MPPFPDDQPSHTLIADADTTFCNGMDCSDDWTTNEALCCVARQTCDDYGTCDSPQVKIEDPEYTYCSGIASNTAECSQNTAQGSTDPATCCAEKQNCASFES